MAKVVTRIPPSPTGHLHIGTARMALFNYLFARQVGGSVIFRSEDTDRVRSSREFEEEIVEGLHWLGLSWDAFSRQSEHAPRHRELLERAVSEGKAYVSREPAKDDPSREVEVVRLKNPGREILFDDLIRGPINTHTGELGDFVIARAIDDPLYHFAVVADDMDAGVTHVIRGEDHISNTARQILIQEALGAPRPAYAHLPLVLNQNRAKLSKRDGVTSVMDYRNEGFLPEAFVNYIALLGWNPGTSEEYFTLEELVREFSIERVQKSGAIWDREKLLSVNQRWMRTLTDEEFAKQMGEELSPAVVTLLKERSRTFAEARALLAGELSFTKSAPRLVKELLTKQGGETLRYLKEVLAILRELPEEVAADEAKAALMPYADKEGRGAVLWPLRYALSGEERSPDPFTILSVIGREEAVSRLEKAIAILGE